jgi:hypothetical protein
MMSRLGQLRNVGLALTCALVAVSCTPEPAATTTSVATTTTTTTTTVPETTSTTVSVDERIAEVTEIVRQVEFGWFEAIYRKDEAALLDVVAVQENYDIGIQLMSDDSFFVAEPTQEANVIEVREILIDRADCLAVSMHVDWTAFRGPIGQGDLTAVYWPRPSDGRWRSAYQGDVWDEACDEFARAGQLP